MTSAAELSDCGWCQSAGSVYRGRCLICDTVVRASTRPVTASGPAETTVDRASETGTGTGSQAQPGAGGRVA